MKHCGLPILLACLGCAAGPSKPAPLAGVEALKTTPWEKQGAVERYGREDLELLLGSASELLLPYDIEQAEALRLQLEQTTVDLTAFRCSSSAEAYCLFTALRARSAPGRNVEIGCAAFSSDREFLLWQGRWVFALRPTEPETIGKAELHALAGCLASQIPGPCAVPYFAAALPREGLDPGSVLCFRSGALLRLVPGFRLCSELGIEPGPSGTPAVEGLYAHYTLGEGDAELCVLFYRDKNQARQAMQKIISRLRPDAVSIRTGGGMEQIGLRDGTTVLLILKGRLLVLVPPTTQRRSAARTAAAYLKALSEELKRLRESQRDREADQESKEK